jgi:hypothetical protein
MFWIQLNSHARTHNIHSIQLPLVVSPNKTQNKEPSMNQIQKAPTNFTLEIKSPLEILLEQPFRPTQHPIVEKEPEQKRRIVFYAKIEKVLVCSVCGSLFCPSSRRITEYQIVGETYE